MSNFNSLFASKLELLKELEKYEIKVRMAKKEIEEIDNALSTLQRYGIFSEESMFPYEPEPKTVADMALEILRDYPDGLTAIQILDKIRERWMPNLMRSSLSPPLSRLKHVGKVILDGSIWSLADERSHYLTLADTVNTIYHQHCVNLSQEEDAEESDYLIQRRA